MAVTLQSPNETRFVATEDFDDFFNWTMTYRHTSASASLFSTKQILTELPSCYEVLSLTVRGLNWKYAHRRDSDIPVPFGKLQEIRADQRRYCEPLCIYYFVYVLFNDAHDWVGFNVGEIKSLINFLVELSDDRYIVSAHNVQAQDDLLHPSC